MLSWLGSFVIKPGVKPMKKINLRAAIATRSTQIAAGAVKQKFRDEGRRLQDFRIGDHANAITALAASDEIVARATRDIERFAKFKSGAQKRNR